MGINQGYILLTTLCAARRTASDALWPSYFDLHTTTNTCGIIYLSGEVGCDWSVVDQPVCTCRISPGAHRYISPPTPDHASFYRAAQVSCALIGRGRYRQVYLSVQVCYTRLTAGSEACSGYVGRGQCWSRFFKVWAVEKCAHVWVRLMFPWGVLNLGGGGRAASFGRSRIHGNGCTGYVSKLIVMLYSDINTLDITRYLGNKMAVKTTIPFLAIFYRHTVLQY